MPIIRSITLGFQEERSDKVYRVELHYDRPGQGSVHEVIAWWGPRLNPNRSTAVKYSGSRGGAEEVYGDLVDSKRNKGYRITSRVDAAPTPSAIDPPVKRQEPARPRRTGQKIDPASRRLNIAPPPIVVGRAITFEEE